MAAFFRQYIAPLLIVLVFLVAMVAVSARIFLPNDLAAPAPIEDPDQQVSLSHPSSEYQPASAAWFVAWSDR